MRQKRDLQKDEIADWEDLREQASAIKEHTLSNLDQYLEEFETKALKNGIRVHWAVNAQEHNNIVFEILQHAGVRKLVKSKSMLTEECHMNPFLKQKGIDATVVIMSDTTNQQTSIDTVSMGALCFLPKDNNTPFVCSQMLSQMMN